VTTVRASGDTTSAGHGDSGVRPRPEARPGDGAHQGSRLFWTACALLGAALVVVYVRLAQAEHFFGDDFLFLRRAQLLRDWLHVLVPLGQRAWWTYRPLSIEVYFSTFYAIAGLDALPYLLATLVLHFACGALVWVIAVVLGIDRRAALVGGLLSVALYPALAGDLFWVSTFQTVCGTFFYLLALALFAGSLAGGRRSLAVASWAAMVLALLSNELAVTLPGPAVLLAFHFAAGGLRTRLRAALVAAAPLIAILCVYLPFRYLLIGPSVYPTPALNLPHLGWHVPWNVVVFLRMLTGQSAAVQAAVALLVVAGWAAAARAGGAAVAALAARALVAGGWLLATMVPFVGAFFVPPRAAIVMQAPFCVLLAAHLDPLLRVARTPAARVAVEAGALGLLLLAIPYAALREQADAPRGALNATLLEILREETPPLPPGACVRLLPPPDETFTAGDLYALRFRTGGLLAVAHPDLHLELPPDPGVAPAWRADCTDRLDLELRHGAPASRPTFVLRRLGRGNA